jgi:hypothetical protein
MVDREDLLQMAKHHFNEPVLTMFTLTRLIGYGEDDDDCYLILVDPYRGTVKHTCVGGYTFLDRLRGQGAAGEFGVWDDFKRLDSLLANNGVPAADEFLLEIK